MVRQIIEETKRDVRRAGWREHVPRRLAEIREHLQDRMRTEEQLLAAMQDTRDSAVREDLRRQAAVLAETVDDCFIRHQDLHAAILSAIRVFIEEQDRQVFGRMAVLGSIDLTSEVLLPILGSRVGAIDNLLTTFAERLLGFGPGPRSASIVPRRQPRIGAFLQALLRPPQTREEVGATLDEVEWEAPPATRPTSANVSPESGSNTCLARFQIGVELRTFAPMFMHDWKALPRRIPATH